MQKPAKLLAGEGQCSVGPGRGSSGSEFPEKVLAVGRLMGAERTSRVLEVICFRRLASVLVLDGGEVEEGGGGGGIASQGLSQRSLSKVWVVLTFAMDFGRDCAICRFCRMVEAALSFESTTSSSEQPLVLS